MSEWMPIKTAPPRPMMVLFYSIDRTWTDEHGNEIVGLFEAAQPYRDERYDLGYWDGRDWCWQGTGHAVWEWPSDIGDPELPTHGAEQ